MSNFAWRNSIVKTRIQFLNKRLKKMKKFKENYKNKKLKRIRNKLFYYQRKKVQLILKILPSSTKKVNYLQASILVILYQDNPQKVAGKKSNSLENCSIKSLKRRFQKSKI